MVNQPKWFTNQEDMKVGDIVLFRKDDKVLSSTYQYGMVAEVMPTDGDGLIRKVKIRYRNPILMCRPCISYRIWPPLRANAPPEKFPTQLPPLKWEVPKFHLPLLIPAGAIHYGCPFILREMHCSPTTPLILNSNKTNNTQFLL